MKTNLMIHKLLIRNNKGVALIVTLAIISILLAAGLHLSKITGDSVLFTIKNNDAFVAKQMAMSGINLAITLLIEDAYKTNIDSVQEIWANADAVEKAVEFLGYQKDDIHLTIEDELGKIQPNALIMDYPGNQLNPDQSLILERFFDLKIENDIAFEQRDSSMIVNSLKDWLDSMDDDTVTGISGAESNYYLGLQQPYLCSNGPFNHISELLFVNGLMGMNSFDFGRFFTVYGLDSIKTPKNGFRYPGRININTADIDVLSAILPEGMEGQAQDLVDFRIQTGQENQTFLNMLDKGWYEKVINLTKKEKDRINRMITYSSDTFKVVCIARKNDVKITMAAFMKREKQKDSAKWTCRILQMEQEY